MRKSGRKRGKIFSQTNRKCRLHLIDENSDSDSPVSSVERAIGRVLVNRVSACIRMTNLSRSVCGGSRLSLS